MKTNLFNQSWNLDNLDFHLVIGDILDIPVDAIVNSEQTDFVLSWNEYSISGQIKRRFGTLVQPELDQLTQHRTLEEGTVLKTGKVADYQAIYHAGFHLPWSYPNFKDDESSQVEYLRIIRYCVRQVLDDFSQTEMDSVAFPLIGTGVFELDPGLLAYEFMRELLSFSKNTILKERKHVWLVIHSTVAERLLNPVLNAAIQALIDTSKFSAAFEPLQLNVPFLDDFEQQVVRSNHPQWSAWLLARFAELISNFVFYNLAVASTPPLHPTVFLEKGKPASFGTLRERAVLIVRDRMISSTDPWTTFLVNLMTRDSSGQRLQRLNSDRNNIAHGRAFRPPLEIYRDIQEFIQVERWSEQVEQYGAPDMKRLYPWLAEMPDQNQGSRIGMLDKWEQRKWLYLIPTTGQSFKLAPPPASE